MAKAKERGNKASIQGLQAPTQEFFVAEVDCSRAITARSTSLRRHCEEAKRRSNPSIPVRRGGLLRFARTDVERVCGRVPSTPPSEAVTALLNLRQHRETADALILVGIEEGVVILERDAAVGLSARPEHVAVGEQSLAVEDLVLTTDRRQPQRVLAAGSLPRADRDGLERR